MRRRSKNRMIFVTVLSATIVAAGAYAAADDAGKTIRIVSEPAGADVYVMGNHAGTTPVMIGEQDIYPISYDTSNEALYGKVLLHMDGCERFSKRLTRSDIRDGLTAVLTCTAEQDAPLPSATTHSAEVAALAVAVQAPVDIPAEPAANRDSPPEQRLQQL